MVKKGRHRRFEEARALKRTDNIDLDAIIENFDAKSDAENTYKPEHDAWADLAAEYEAKSAPASNSDIDDDYEENQESA